MLGRLIVVIIRIIHSIKLLYGTPDTYMLITAQSKKKKSNIPI